MPVHLIYGDEFLVTQALKEFQAQVGPEEVLEANSHRIAGVQAEPGGLRILCDATPFLAQHRLVVVEGLLSLFEPRAGRRRVRNPAGGSSSKGAPSPQTAQGSLKGWEEFPQYISQQMSPTTILVFTEGRLSGRNALLRLLRPILEIHQCPTPTGESLNRWIRNRTVEKGARISPGAINLLNQLVGENLRSVDNELEKLSLYAEDESIEESHVRLLVSQAREASIFRAVDSILDGRPSVALPLVHRLRDEGSEFPYIVAMIARQLRQVTLAKDLVNRGHRPSEIGNRLGITNEFALKRTMEQARKHSWARLKGLYERLMQADLAVKRGRLGQDLALEILIGEVSGSR